MSAFNPGDESAVCMKTNGELVLREATLDSDGAKKCADPVPE
ncbi:MAG: hypothetical protein WB679_06660 [Terracidiphilus sp.]